MPPRRRRFPANPIFDCPTMRDQSWVDSQPVRTRRLPHGIHMHVQHPPQDQAYTREPPRENGFRESPPSHALSRMYIYFYISIRALGAQGEASGHKPPSRVSCPPSWASKTPQDASKTPPRRAKTRQHPPRRPHDPSKTPPTGLQDPPRRPKRRPDPRKCLQNGAK